MESDPNPDSPKKEAHRAAQSRRAILAKRRAGMSWRTIGRLYKVNHYYIIAFVLHGKVPSNPEVRRRLGLTRPAWLDQAVEWLRTHERR